MRISSKKRSTMSFASRLLRPSCSKSRSASSAFVSVIGILSAKGAAESTFDQPHHAGDGRVDFSVGQSTLSILHKHKNRKAFLAFSDAAAAIDVEELERLHMTGPNVS